MRSAKRAPAHRAVRTFAVRSFLLGTVLAFTGASIAAAAGPVPTFLFKGELRVAAPAVLSGLIVPGADNGFRLVSTLDPSLTEVPLTDFSEARLSISERRWVTIDDEHSGSPVSVPLPANHEYSSIQAKRVVISVVGVREHGSIVTSGVAGLSDAEPTFELAGSCRALPGNLTTGLVIPAKVGSWRTTTYKGLIADCQANLLTLSGPQYIGFEDVLLRVSYEDRDGAHERFFDVGTHSRPSERPGMTEHTSISFSVTPRNRDGSLRLGANQTLRIESPSLMVFGALGWGQARVLGQWGPRAINESVPSAVLQGYFSLTSDEKADSFVVDGQTTTAPPEPPLADAAKAPLFTRSAIAVVGLSSLLAWPRARFFLLGLFTRLSRKKALDHPRRRLVLDFIEENPGINVRRLAALSGLARGLVRYHIGVLSSQGLVQCRRYAGQVGCFAAGVAPSAAALTIYLRNPWRQRIVAELAGEPRQTQASLATKVGITQSFASKVLRQLITLGAIERRSDPEGPGYFVRGETDATRSG